jgi:hypothetical protein
MARKKTKNKKEQQAKKKDTNTDPQPIGGQTIEDPSGAKKSVHKKNRTTTQAPKQKNKEMAQDRETGKRAAQNRNGWLDT